MCGIVGIFNLKQPSSALRGKALDMAKRIRHRGPDWSGIYCGSSAILAHERLSIVDPQSGGQPLFSADGRQVLAVNGEIYNHRTLRQQLDYPFRTGSDCEVILPLYRRRGVDFLEELNGIFAFALYDEERDEFLIARDPIGVIPLYIGYDTDGTVYCASELKALEGQCERYEPFPPGHYYWSREGKMTRWYKREWTDYDAVKDNPASVNELHDALEAAVQRQLMSDVPYGVLLSGGLDSSIISAVAKKYAARRIETGGRQEAWWPQLHSFAIGLEGAPDLAKARDDVSVQVAQAYVQILYGMELRDVAQRQIAIDSMQVERLSEMYRTGKASGVEVAQQKATLAQSRLTYTQADNDYRLALLSLAQLLELPTPEGFAIVRPDAAALTVGGGAGMPLPDEIYQEAVAVKPEVKAEAYRLKGAEMNIKLAKSALLPTLSLTAGLGSNYYKTSGLEAKSFGWQMRNNFSQYVGFNLSIPIFNRLATRNNIRTAQLNHETQQLQLENVKKSLYKEIQQAYYNALAAKAQYESSREAVASNKAAFDLMSAKYEYGKANITEFNESKNNLLKAESDLARSKYEYMYDMSLIDFYRGRSLDF